MPATSVTRSFTSIVALTLDKVRPILEDTISKSNKLLYFYKKADNWKGVSSLGDRLRVPLMYELAPADSYSSFGTIDTTPADGVTAAFFDWRQAAAVIALSGLEEAQNRGTEGIVDILKARTMQATLGLEDLFSKAMLQGQGSVDSTSITSPRVSPVNGSTFIDPLPLLVKYAPTTSTSIGGINQSTNAWWQNPVGGTAGDSGASTYAGFLQELRNLYNLASKGGGGSKGQPDFFLCDQATFEVYESALAATSHNTSYVKADIPFDNVAFKGNPIMWDEYVPDVKNGDLTPTGSDSGTFYALNSNYMGVSFDKSHSFTVGEFVRPENQDARAAQVLWYGAHWISNRRKCAVLGGINTTIAL